MMPLTEKPTENYDKKKIAVAIVIVFLVFGAFIAFKQMYFPTPRKVTAPSVEGMQTSNSPSKTSFSLPNVNDLQGKVNEIKDQVSHIDVAEIASSSPQVQDIIKQINNLPNLPRNVAKQVCQELCKKL